MKTKPVSQKIAVRARTGGTLRWIAVMVAIAVVQSILGAVYAQKLPAFQSDAFARQTDDFSSPILPPAIYQPPSALLQYGPIIAHPSLAYTQMYATALLVQAAVIQDGNGIPTGATNAVRRDSAVQQVKPAVDIFLGDRWLLKYGAAWQTYSGQQLEDSWSHEESLTGQVTWGAWDFNLVHGLSLGSNPVMQSGRQGGQRALGDSRSQDRLSHHETVSASISLGDWDFSVSQQISMTSDLSIETGGQVGRKTYTTTLAASHSFSERITADFSVKQKIQDAAGFSSSKEWSTMNWLNYKVSEYFSAAGGLGGGYVSSEQGADMTYEQFSGRIRWTPGGDKFSAELSLGGKVRQFLNKDLNSRLEPVLGLTLNYRPFEATFLTLSAHRSTHTSLLRNQFAESTDITLGLRQRLLGKVFLEVTPGYHFRDYIAQGPSEIPNPNGGQPAIVSGSFTKTREDENFFLSTQLSMAFLKRGQIALFYNLNDSDSTFLLADPSDPILPNNNFRSTQVGLTISYQF